MPRSHVLCVLCVCLFTPLSARASLVGSTCATLCANEHTWLVHRALDRIDDTMSDVDERIELVADGLDSLGGRLAGLGPALAAFDARVATFDARATDGAATLAFVNTTASMLMALMEAAGVPETLAEAGR